MQTRRLELPATPPFSLEQTLSFVRAFYARDYERVPAHEQIVEGKLRRVVSVAGKPLLFEVEAGTAETVVVTFYAERLDDALVAAATDRVRFYLGLDDDLTPLYSRADPVFKGVLEDLYGYHMLKVLTPFEAACWAMVQQRTPNAFAHKTMARFTEQFGSRLTIGGETHTAFPEARAMAGDPHARVLAATNNTRKTERMLSLIGTFAGADETFLRRAPYGDVARWLLKIRGFGAWSVDFVMLRGLGRTDLAPWTDTGLLRAVSKIYTGGFEVSPGYARELAERYGGEQGLWAHYVKFAAQRAELRPQSKVSQTPAQTGAAR